MRVLIAGATGFLGSALSDRLRADGHQVVRLVRRDGAAGGGAPSGGGQPDVSWRPAAGLLDPAALSRIDAVVNLAGSPLGTRIGRLQVPVRPWTAGYREQFRGSRVDTTATLARAIAEADRKPAVFLAGSAVGWYGDTGDTEVDEQAPAGDGFFADTCRVWEAATGPAERAGVRVVRMRTGFPLHRSGGLLGPQLLPLRLGLGGRIGNGRQWQPWISMTDWLDAVVFLLARDDIAGPVNLVGPAPVRNGELTRALGQLLHRPTLVPVPGPLLRLVLGEFGNDALASKRVLPGVLTQAGFSFTHRELRPALEAALSR